MTKNKDDEVLITKAQVRTLLNKEKFMENKQMWEELHRGLTAMEPVLIKKNF